MGQKYFFCKTIFFEKKKFFLLHIKPFARQKIEILIKFIRILNNLHRCVTPINIYDDNSVKTKEVRVLRHIFSLPALAKQNNVDLITSAQMFDAVWKFQFELGCVCNNVLLVHEAINIS